MSREEALNNAPPDPLGRRWAKARRRAWVYLAWSDGEREVIQLARGQVCVGQVRSTPESLVWIPLSAWEPLR